MVVHSNNQNNAVIVNNEVRRFYRLSDSITKHPQGWQTAIKHKLYIEDGRILKLYGDSTANDRQIYIVWPLIWAQHGKFKWRQENNGVQTRYQVETVSRPRYLMPDFFKQYHLNKSLERIDSIF